MRRPSGRCRARPKLNRTCRPLARRAKTAGPQGNGTDRMWGYQRRLNHDLGRWVDAGWVSPQAAEAIRSDAARAPGLGLAGVLGILASVLLALRRHELCRRALGRDAKRRASGVAVCDHVELLHRQHCFPSPQHASLSRCIDPGRRLGVRRLDHAHRADVPHRRSSARRLPDVVAGCAPFRRGAAIQSGSGLGAGAGVRVDVRVDERT